MNQRIPRKRVADIESVPRTVAIQRCIFRIASPPPEDLVNMVLHRFQSCHHNELRLLHCDFQHGDIIIRGRVSSFHLKQLAQEMIRTIAGGVRIVNQLDVAGISDNQIS